MDNFSTLENMGVAKVAVLGATSSIFNSLINEAAFFPGFALHLFSRSPERVSSLERKGLSENSLLSDFSNSTDEFDYVLNFIGTGDPRMSRDSLTALVTASLALDSIVLARLRSGSLGKYINISSGSARYSVLSGDIDSYPKLKAHLEAVHKDSGLDIVDIRIYGYADSKAKFFPGTLVGDIKAALTSGGTLVTDREPVVRDYIGREELLQLLNLLIHSNTDQRVIEPYSLEPLEKAFLLQVLDKANLITAQTVSSLPTPISGVKPDYRPNFGTCPSGYIPRRRSIEVVIDALGLDLRLLNL